MIGSLRSRQSEEESFMRWLSWLALLIGVLACLAPIAHFLELPNKLYLEGVLWLAVQ
jgi:hypothetical protein